VSATTTRDAKADAALALLCERWPKCFFMFSGRRLPLKIGIRKDIPDGLIEPKILRLAFRLYVNNPGYLNAMRLGVARVDLNGEVAGTVGEKDAKSAQARLNGIRKVRKNRKQSRREKAAQDVVSAPPPAPSPAPPPRRQQPSQRDSLASLREAARKRRGAA
jgi:ProP effector